MVFKALHPPPPTPKTRTLGFNFDFVDSGTPKLTDIFFKPANINKNLTITK